VTWLALRAEIGAEFAALTEHTEQLEDRCYRRWQWRRAHAVRLRRELTEELKRKRAARPPWNPGRAPLDFVCAVCAERFGLLKGLQAHCRKAHRIARRAA